jgi:rubrerythrin
METRLDALNVALTNEMREHEFYLNNAKRTGNAVGKAMFQQIAGEELEHYERLKQLSESWKKQEKWPETVPLKVKNTVVRDVLKDVVKKAAAVPAGDTDDLTAIRIAIDFEAKGAAFYARLRDELTEPREKAFFDLMAGIEQEHFASLKDTEEYLTDPVDWYRKMERGGLDGA